MTTTDPKSALPDEELEALAEAIAGRPDDHKDAIILLAYDYVAPYRAHIAALEAKLKATEQTLDSSNQTFRIMVHRLQMQEAENKRLREALVNRFNRDWTNTTEALEQALKETFTAQRSEIMAVLAQADGKAGV